MIVYIQAAFLVTAIIISLPCFIADIYKSLKRWKEEGIFNEE